MKVTIIAIVIGAFGTVTKGLLKGLHPNVWVFVIPYTSSNLGLKGFNEGAFNTWQNCLLTRLQLIKIGCNDIRDLENVL